MASPAGLLTTTARGATRSYNSAQQLTGMVPVVGPVVSFAYDGRGSRVSSTATAAAATDPDTKLVYLRARDYDPVTGQFLIVDPAVDLTRQPYAYAGNNPVSTTDPTGLD